MHLTEHDEVASPHLPLGQPASLARRMRQPVNPFLPVAGSRLCQSDALPSAWQFENRIRKLSGRSPLMLRHRAHSSPNNLRSGLGLGSPMKRRAPRAGLLLGQALDAVVGPPGSERKREVGKDFGAAPAPAAIGSALARACEDSRNSVVPAAQRSTGGSLTARPRRASAPNALAPLPRPGERGGGGGGGGEGGGGGGGERGGGSDGGGGATRQGARSTFTGRCGVCAFRHGRSRNAAAPHHRLRSSPLRSRRRQPRADRMGERKGAARERGGIIGMEQCVSPSRQPFPQDPPSHRTAGEGTHYVQHHSREP